MPTNQELRVGVLVRFLNAIGGGRVARIQGDTAWVEDEDGFEIPTPLKECVPVEAGDTFIPESRPPKVIQEKLQTKSPKPTEPAPARAKVQTPAVRPVALRRALGEELSVHLAFLPEDRTKLGITPYEAYLINASDFTLYYTYLSAVGTGYKLRASGELAPHEDVLLETFVPATLNELEHLVVQILPFAPEALVQLPEPASVRLRLDTTKFFKLHAFRPNDYFLDEALLLPVLVRGKGVEPLEVDAQALTEALQSRPVTTPPKSATPVAPAPRPDAPLVIDLHASALLDTLAGLSAAAILQYQLDTFHRTMREHLKERGKKLIFIHGKGDGVLRSALERELRHKYRACRFQDASFQEYGYGATQVTIA